MMHDEPRIRELVELIREEKDSEKIKILAAELEQLLAVKDEPCPPSRKKPDAS
jgi:hypothetical protein